MDRRRYLGWCLTGIAGGLAGCSGALPSTGVSPPRSGTRRRRETPSPALAGVGFPVPASELDRGAPRDAIPAITEPSFGPDWSDTDTAPLADDDRVVGITRGDGARAYPLRVLNWHELVNDTFAGPLLVTYCPLCGSGMTAERRVGVTTSIFGVSGLLFRSNLVLYDRTTGSLWSQLAARAIRGPRTGDRLRLVPSTMTTWGVWSATHPNTEVLLPPPESATVDGPTVREYDRNPYAGYDPYEGYQASRRVASDGPDVRNGYPHPKERVVGVTAGGTATAYPLTTVAKAGVINDTVGDRPVVVAVARDGWSLRAYDRRVDGRALAFEPAGRRHMRAGGSRWAIATGRATDGPHAGATLASASSMGPVFWFAWEDFYPDTTVYRHDG